MVIDVTRVRVKKILTRTTGYLRTITSHSLQPYRGCTFGNSLCGVGCYVQHNPFVARRRAWGSFLEVRDNAAESYLECYSAERRWGRKARGEFGIFLSSATEPFLPQEFRYRITGQVLEAMVERPPDTLILQTHCHRIVEYLDVCKELSRRCALRAHISIESDRDRLPGLPASASPVERRFAAARTLKDSGVRTVITVSPLLPLDDPERFFARAAACADAVVLDHFAEGDGSALGQRTRRTPLPEAMARVLPESVELGYRQRMVEIARRHLPGRVGVNIDGFAGRYA